MRVKKVGGLTIAAMVIQLFFSIIIGLYFYNQLKSQQGTKTAVEKESRRELERLRRMRQRSLTEPLSEKTRPRTFQDIVGQKEGIVSLKAALCGPNPQHVIIYGPPGVGKTCAARLVLQEAQKTEGSPFKADAKFVEMDATCVRFDERSIADPLIGSVHDPIYQGAGAMGMAGIPQPKPGAVTKAHGGILFLDEIGELHPIQLNKLLKVLEDRKVFLESAYYSQDDAQVPQHIHDIFQNGLPADFRLVGATTKSPEEIPMAIRSRCVEIYFKPLTPSQVREVARNAALKGGFALEMEAADTVGRYATNGRDAVNIVQMAGGLSRMDGRKDILRSDVEWILQHGRYAPRVERPAEKKPQVGVVHGLAVYGAGQGMVMQVEALARPAAPGLGVQWVTGIIEEEEMNGGNRKLRRKSTAQASVTTVATALKEVYGVDIRNYDIHLNVSGGMAVDGPSAGIAIAVAIYSAIFGIPVDGRVAMTGEISIRGDVRPVGGVLAKTEAAREAGVERVYVPEQNAQELVGNMGIEIVPASHLSDVMEGALLREEQPIAAAAPAEVLSAESSF
ncbi:ATP-dependent protease LonB [Gehongia tenuis]|uniref:endopeptidase La n=1 Tax=Gehongia tenuis TaxID=2763655 RepID=A0A926HKC8_9FIRM|nr:ATP-dependent protease LonB [Gehongia tenuis]MBC8530837.1 ATP-dependent protease LonB [Gehongia tenuis]